MNRKAFTLLEQLFAIIIIGILFGTASYLFFPVLKMSYVDMVHNDIEIAVNENLKYHANHGRYFYSSKRLMPKENGVLEIPGYTKIHMSYPKEFGMRYEAKFDRGICSDGKQGFKIEYWLNRGSLDPEPHLYGVFNSCTYGRVIVKECTYQNGKKICKER